MNVGNVVGAYNGDFNSCSIIKTEEFYFGIFMFFLVQNDWQKK